MAIAGVAIDCGEELTVRPTTGDVVEVGLGVEGGGVCDTVGAE